MASLAARGAFTPRVGGTALSQSKTGKQHIVSSNNFNAVEQAQRKNRVTNGLVSSVQQQSSQSTFRWMLVIVDGVSRRVASLFISFIRMRTTNLLPDYNLIRRNEHRRNARVQ